MSAYTILERTKENAEMAELSRTEAAIDKKLNVSTYIVTSSAWKNGKIVHVDKIKPIQQFE